MNGFALAWARFQQGIAPGDEALEVDTAAVAEWFWNAAFVELRLEADGWPARDRDVIQKALRHAHEGRMP